MPPVLLSVGLERGVCPADEKHGIAVPDLGAAPRHGCVEVGDFSDGQFVGELFGRYRITGRRIEDDVIVSEAKFRLGQNGGDRFVGRKTQNDSPAPSEDFPNTGGDGTTPTYKGVATVRGDVPPGDGHTSPEQPLGDGRAQKADTNQPDGVTSVQRPPSLHTSTLVFPIFHYQMVTATRAATSAG
jgi:hypothetical protein